MLNVAAPVASDVIDTKAQRILLGQKVLPKAVAKRTTVGTASIKQLCSEGGNSSRRKRGGESSTFLPIGSLSP